MRVDGGGGGDDDDGNDGGGGGGSSGGGKWGDSVCDGFHRHTMVKLLRTPDSTPAQLMNVTAQRRQQQQAPSSRHGLRLGL